MTGPRKPNTLSSDPTCTGEQVYGRSTRLFDDERVQDSLLTLDGSVPILEDQVIGFGESLVKIEAIRRHDPLSGRPVTMAESYQSRSPSYVEFN